MTIGIYKITNQINGKIYIGQTNNLKRRKRKHFLLLKSNNHPNKFLQSDFNKCGGECVFNFDILLVCDENNLNFYEQRFLDYYFDNQNNCYNISKNAEAFARGITWQLSVEVRQKMSERMMGKKYGLGYKHSADAKRKISNSKTKRSFVVVSPNGEIISSENTSEFCRIHNLSQPHFHGLISGKRKTHKGWKKA